MSERKFKIGDAVRSQWCNAAGESCTVSGVVVDYSLQPGWYWVLDADGFESKAKESEMEPCP